MNRFHFGFGVAASLTSANVCAEPTANDKALAKKLYQQAVADMTREAYDRACPQFASALELDPTHVRTAISLGTCEERSGKFMSALEQYANARKLAVAQSLGDKIIEIDQLTADLKPRIPFLRIMVPDRWTAIDGFIVVRSGTIVPVADYGKAVQVDPGPYEINASSPTTGVWKKAVVIQERQTVDVTIGDDAASTRENATVSSSGAADKPGPGARKGLGFVGIGLGAAGLIAGSVLGGLAIAKNDASNEGHCDADSYCDATGFTLRQEAKHYANVSTGLFIVGGAFLGAGVILVATVPGKTPQAHATNTTQLLLGPGMIGIRGHW